MSRGCGVLVDRESRLVLTVASVVGDRENAHIFFSTTASREGAVESSSLYSIAGKVIYRDERRGLVILRLERLPEGAAPLPLGEWSHLPSRVFHSVYRRATSSPPGAESAWVQTQGQIGRVLMPPHF
jgi:hypothetical protein